MARHCACRRIRNASLSAHAQRQQAVDAVYDKPMIFYPISVLIKAGIREIAIITAPDQQHLFKELLKDGSQWGCSFTYVVQEKPAGLAQAFTLCEDFSRATTRV